MLIVQLEKPSFPNEVNSIALFGSKILLSVLLISSCRNSRSTSKPYIPICITVISVVICLEFYAPIVGRECLNIPCIQNVNFLCKYFKIHAIDLMTLNFFSRILNTYHKTRWKNNTLSFGCIIICLATVKYTLKKTMFRRSPISHGSFSDHSTIH